MFTFSQLKMWRAACRCSSVIRNSRSVELLTVLYCGETQYASYHSTKPLLIPKDTGLKLAERLRCSLFTSSGKLSRTAGFPSTKRPQRKEPPASHPERRVPSELQKLSLEDFTEAEAQKLNKGTQKVKTAQVKGTKEHDMVFGVAPCLLALSQARRTPNCLFVKSSEGRPREAVQRVCEEALRHGVPIQRVSKRELDKMTGGMVHQGVCLQASPLGFITKEKPTRPQHGGHPHPLWLVLDGVQDPMNLGSILRSAYFLGVDRVASSIQNSCPLTPVVSKASSGVMELMDVYGYSNLADIVKMKLEQGWQAVGTVGSEEAFSGASVVSCSDFRMSKPTLLLMGGEGFGLSPELRQLCDILLTIPPRRDLHPAVDSLNVSVATGILLHSILSSCRAG
ncbi:rRNA methyltransferase 1, mitochondrial isoform X2 [Colossoma macropomum]|uniref:rRNA methyltransferase 1, mitochondrial isoform X2 n=1 Tax=Colossoma macropomum TaxID=42526 RepID=UPI0018642BA2|nr:rRNA methyltransferase 1, mitochondrial isoform X2 [Colossoma macropomum]